MYIWPVTEENVTSDTLNENISEDTQRKKKPT